MIPSSGERAAAAVAEELFGEVVRYLWGAISDGRVIVNDPRRSRAKLLDDVSGPAAWGASTAAPEADGKQIAENN